MRERVESDAWSIEFGNRGKNEKKWEYSPKIFLEQPHNGQLAKQTADFDNNTENNKVFFKVWRL